MIAATISVIGSTTVDVTPSPAGRGGVLIELGDELYIFLSREVADELAAKILDLPSSS